VTGVYDYVVDRHLRHIAAFGIRLDRRRLDPVVAAYHAGRPLQVRAWLLPAAVFVELDVDPFELVDVDPAGAVTVADDVHEFDGELDYVA
jgi:hypothetical protein